MAKRVLGNDPFATGAESDKAVKAGDKPTGRRRPSSALGTPVNKATPATDSSKRASGGKVLATASPRPATKNPPGARRSGPKKAARKPEAVATPQSPTMNAVSGPPVQPTTVAAQPDMTGASDGIATTSMTTDDATGTLAAGASATPELVVPASGSQSEGQPDGDAGVIHEAASLASVDSSADEKPAAPRTTRDPSAGERPARESEPGGDLPGIEAEIDRLLGAVSERGAGRETLDRLAARLRERIGGDEDARRPSEPPSRDDPSVFDVARELLSSDFYRQKWGRVAMRDRTEEIDDFGLDPKYAARLRPFFDFLYERWWRIETHDIDRVPSAGRVILCANHSGALPYDGAMLATALRREHVAHRSLRWLAEDFIFHFPFLGVFMNRIGAVRACQENAERLLHQDACVGVFPEGVKGISKPYADRYQLQRFGRGGHVKLAIRTRTPIVPVAIVGAEEVHPLLAPTSLLAKALGVPFVPVTPTFPWFGALGLIPLPSKWKIFFLDPIAMDDYAPEAADDEVLVGRLNEKIRGLIQEELDRAVRARQSVLRG